MSMNSNVNYKDFDSYKKVYDSVYAVLTDINAEANLRDEAEMASAECRANGIDLCGVKLLEKAYCDAINNIKEQSGIEIEMMEDYGYQYAIGYVVSQDILVCSAAFREIVEKYRLIVEEKVKPFYHLKTIGRKTVISPEYRKEDLKIWLNLAKELSDFNHKIKLYKGDYLIPYNVVRNFMYTIAKELLKGNIRKKYHPEDDMFAFDYMVKNAYFIDTLPQSTRYSDVLANATRVTIKEEELRDVNEYIAKAEEVKKPVVDKPSKGNPQQKKAKARKQQKEVSNKKKKDSKALDTYKTEKAVFERLEAFCAWYRENHGELYVYRNACTNEVKDKRGLPFDYIFCKRKQEVNANGTCTNFNKEDVVVAIELDGEQHTKRVALFHDESYNGKDTYVLQVSHEKTKQMWTNNHWIAFQRFNNWGPDFVDEIAENIIGFVEQSLKYQAYVKRLEEVVKKVAPQLLVVA